MKNKLDVKKCDECLAVVYEMQPCTCDGCGISCCQKQMRQLTPNIDGVLGEKHIPTYERVEDEIYVKVNHVMEKTHYIEWLACVKDNTVNICKLYPEGDATCRFKYIPGSTLYVYCNKHELWSSEVK